MSDFRATLAHASAQNHELLSILAQTDYAPPALKQNLAYISDLEKQIRALEKELKKLHELTEDERKDHVKYRDSTVKRLAYKMGGKKGQAKFSAKSEKEEREFLEAWQKERETTERRDELQRALEVAKSDKQHLENEQTRHDRAQADLDLMYNAIFTGPTPDVQGEDQMEQTVTRCRDWFQQCQTQVGADKLAMDGLNSADHNMTQALREMENALDASTMDMWGGGTFSDMMERDALSRAQNSLTQTLWILNEASRAQPAIRNLSNVSIDHGHLMGDVMFDNIFSDFAQHERIEKSAAQMQQASLELKQQVTEQKQRLRDAEALQKQASQALEDARQELQRIRAEAFERLAGGSGYGGTAVYGMAGDVNEAPPSYTSW